MNRESEGDARGQVDPYTMPSWSSSALVTIDVQRDTLDGQPLEIAGTSAALPAMERLVRAFRSYGRPVVHVVRLYKADGSNVDLCRRRAIENGQAMLLAGSEGSQLATSLLPQPQLRLTVGALLGGEFQKVGAGEWIMYKPRWGAFFGTPLEGFLREQGVSTIVVCGCNYPNCPRTTIYEASERDFRVVATMDAISGIDLSTTQELANIGVSVLPSELIVRSLDEFARIG